MDQVVKLKDFINYHLTTLASRIKNYTASNQTDWAIHSETFFAEILSIVFDCEFRNHNLHSASTQTIDLGDPDARIAVQVTANARRSKIVATLKAFKQNKLYEQFDRLYFIIISNDVKDYRDLPPDEVIKFEQKLHIMFIPHLYNAVSSLPINKLEEISDIIKSYTGTSRNPFLLSSDPWNFRPQHRRAAYVRYAKAYLSAIENSVNPVFVGEDHPDPLIAELDIPLFAPIARLWAARLKEFGIAFILDLSNEQLRAVRHFISILIETEQALDTFVASSRVNELRNVKYWGELDSKKDALKIAVKSIETALNTSDE